jgi:hypothetical protein
MTEAIPTNPPADDDKEGLARLAQFEDCASGSAFGKLECDDAGQMVAWHPLLDHLIDVAACFVRLCQCRSIRRAMERAAGRKLTSKDIVRLAVLVFLHAGRHLRCNDGPCSTALALSRQRDPLLQHMSAQIRVDQPPGHLGNGFA